MSLFFHIEASVQTLKDLCRKQLCLFRDSIILVYDFKLGPQHDSVDKSACHKP